MSIRNRELSQFGSFIYVENSNKEIGITTEALPYVGFGTTNPQYKIDVVGDANVSGIISATGYYLNGVPLVDATTQYWELSGDDVYLATIGNVGVGTSVPTQKLDVVGNIRGTGSITGSNLYLSNSFSIVSGIVTGSRFISTVSTGTAPLTVNSQTLVTNLNADYLRGKVPPSGTIVGTTDAQTLTNKTLTLPIFSGTGVGFTGSTSGITTVRASETASGTIVLPAVTGIQTFVTTNAVGVVTSGMIADLSITNADVATSAAIAYSKLSLSNSIVNGDIASGASIAISKLASSTISGISLGGNLESLTAGSFITYSSGSTYNGSTPITIGVAGTTANTASTLVARDSSGDFSAGTINCSNLTAAFEVTAADINSTSDLALKTNVNTIENSLDIVNSLRGVSFDWKLNGKKSYGVIAQEIEEVLPDLVATKENKSVNYNGLVGVLIQAVKELSAEVEDLKKQLNN